MVRWTIERYNISPDTKIIRPFWPDSDYKTLDYPEGAVVIDNPPFSIAAEILRWYNERGIKYLLFANHLTLFNSARHATPIVTNAAVIYENGANVSTSFITNMDTNALVLAGDLATRLNALKPQKRKAKSILPGDIHNAATMGKFASLGMCEEFTHDEIRTVKNYCGKGVFGTGLMIPRDRGVSMMNKWAAAAAAAAAAAEDEEQEIKDMREELNRKQ